MKSPYVSFELSKRLKEIKYNEPCSWFYVDENNKHKFNSAFGGVYQDLDNIFGEDSTNCTLAPLYSDIIEWLETKHNIEVLTKSWKSYNGIIYLYTINKLGEPSTYRHGEFVCNSRDEAREKAILEAIKNL